ncbi:phosphotransferase [Microbacterium tumbae]
MPDPAVIARTAPDADAALVREALAVDEARMISGEPLGSGSVSGFAVGRPGAEQIHYLDTSALAVSEETGLALVDEDGVTRTRIWPHPADPHLPALPATAFAHSLEILLHRLGIETAGSAEMVGYRPGRRAVLRVPTMSGITWIKVVRPRRVARIVRAHEACATAGLPLPRLRGWAEEGLIVLDSAIGAPAADVVWEPVTLLDETDALRERIGRTPWSERTRPIATRLGWYAGRLRDDARASALLRRVGSAIEDLPESEPVVVHGDLHYGQLFLTEGRISGFIDVDTLGRGAAAEDTAAFLAHAIASARLTPPPHTARIRDLADAALGRWGDDRAVRPYTAVHLLGHAIAARVAGDEEGEDSFLDAAARILEGGEASSDAG